MLSNYADLDSLHPVRSSGTEKLNIKQSRLLCGDKYNANCMLTQSKYVFLIQSALFDLRHSISFMAKINSLLKEILTEYYKFTHLMKGHTCIVAFCNHLSSSKQTSQRLLAFEPEFDRNQPCKQYAHVQTCLSFSACITPQLLANKIFKSYQMSS